MSSTVIQDIALFFEKPSVVPVIPRKCGILHLLRRDIETCLGYAPSSGDALGSKALWPATMAVLAGIDLLGKFFAGDDSLGKAGKRFEDFLAAYFPSLNAHDRTVIYHLRNSLMHSFGLYSKDGKGNEYFFTLDDSNGPLVTAGTGGHYTVDILTLKNEFDVAVGRYEQSLQIDSTLQKNFQAMFPKYGAVKIW